MDVVHSINARIIRLFYLIHGVLMNRKSKARLSTVGAISFVVLMTAQMSFVKGDSVCANFDEVDFNTNLPMSHPLNRCASEQKNDVSWTSWFSGRSPSYQFHYLDLLELLSRVGEDSTERHRGNQ